ncbi:MAG: hypothetical protein IKF17_05280 [Clostridia bacterium]|nr:hypothetical protein [Clostridia bacterium]
MPKNPRYKNSNKLLRPTQYGVAIILYNPTKEQILKIKEYNTCFEKIFIFDNSEHNHNKSYINSLKDYYYYSENENKGLPYALNYILETDECKELDFLCTLDQDSTFKSEDILNIQSKINSMDNKCLGIIAPYINYGYNHKKKTNKLIEKKWVITSGSFIYLKNLYNMNLRYDENYFLDRAEVDLCKQIIRSNKKIFMYYNSTLYQRLGEDSGYKHPNHNVLRHYYIFRNRFYFNNKWYGMIKKCALNFLQTLNHITKIVLFEDEKIKKIKILRIAYIDYKNYEMGKYKC